MGHEWFTPITYAIGLLLAVVGVVTLFALNMDIHSQAYCDDAAHEFVDNARAAGYISATSYIEFRQRLNNTGNLYDVTISHDSKASHPMTDAAGNEIEGRYMNGKTSYNQNEITSYMFPDNSDEFCNYPLKEGDYLKVSYTLKSSTFGGKLIKMWLNVNGKSISGSYGGYVGSIEENGTAVGGQ